VFEIILDYLRSDYLKNLSENCLEELKVEAEYFMLSSLLEIIQQRLGVEEQNNSNSKDEVYVIVNGKTFKCKPHALQYCDKELIDQNGDFNARDYIINHPTLEDFVRRVLRRLEDNRVGDVMPPQHRTELWEDSFAAHLMGLLPDSKGFY
jgi:hypothetical protein